MRSKVDHGAIAAGERPLRILLGECDTVDWEGVSWKMSRHFCASLESLRGDNGGR